MDSEPMTIAQAVATVQRVAEYNRTPDPLPQAKASEAVDDAVMILSEAIALDERAEAALDLLVQHLNAHMNVTMYLARWWDVQTGPVTSQFGVISTRRWMQLMDAFRAAQEL